MISFIIQGEIPSKKNAWRRGARGVYIEAEMARQLDQLLLQIKTRKPPEPIKELVAIELRFHGKYKTDIDNRVTTLFDLLQKGGVISNDRNVLGFEAHDEAPGHQSRDWYTEIFVDKGLVGGS